MSMRSYLDFEKPVAELEAKVAPPAESEARRDGLRNLKITIPDPVNLAVEMAAE